eukprot:5019816-Karenia_brevis.AAC.1
MSAQGRSFEAHIDEHRKSINDGTIHACCITAHADTAVSLPLFPSVSTLTTKFFPSYPQRPWGSPVLG